MSPFCSDGIPGERHKNADRTRTTLWQYDRPKASREHPTMKPIALWVQAVQDGSRKGELVYDPFLGSGTTIIAAEQTGRVCYGMEIDPKYSDVVRRRWAEFVYGENCDWGKTDAGGRKRGLPLRKPQSKPGYRRLRLFLPWCGSTYRPSGTDSNFPRSSLLRKRLASPRLAISLMILE